MNFCKLSTLYPKRLLILICISVSFSLVANGQVAVFTPATEDTVLLEKLYSNYEDKFNKELAALSANNKKDYEEAYRDRLEYIKEKFHKKEIYTSQIAQQYLDALVNEVKKANPVLQKQSFECYFSRSGVPNASYIGEGIILFNMGLFEKLDNESEAAFVICHEIAHYVMKHSDKRIADYVTAINSDEVQKELKKIKGSQYRKREQLEKLVKGLTFDSRRHGRDHESEADSLAVELMHNSRFNVMASITTLNLLDSIDNDTLNTAACLERMFNFPAFPFKKKWIAHEEGLLGGHAKLTVDSALADSLKTHPDCKQRIKILEPLVNKYTSANASNDVVNKHEFDSLKNAFSYEIISYAFASKNFTRSFYYTLKLLQKNPDDSYLIVQVGKILNGFYACQKTHTLGKVIELPAPGNSANYNSLLQFVQNLYLDDYASLSYHYLDQHSEKLNSYAPFKTEYSISIQTAKQ